MNISLYVYDCCISTAIIQSVDCKKELTNVNFISKDLIFMIYSENNFSPDNRDYWMIIFFLL